MLGTSTTAHGPWTAIVNIDGVSGFTLNNLILRGDGSATSPTQWGIHIYNDYSNGVPAANDSTSSTTADTITIENTDIGGVQVTTPTDASSEIFFAGWVRTDDVCGAINNVKFLNNTLHGLNGVTSKDDNGIWGYTCNNITNVLYQGNTVYDIGGTGFNSSEGNGILANGIDGAVIQDNVAHDLGAAANTCGGRQVFGHMTLMMSLFNITRYIMSGRLNTPPAATGMASTSTAA